MCFGTKPLAKVPQRGAGVLCVGGGFSTLGGSEVVNYLDGLAQKLNLASSGCKANVLLGSKPPAKVPQ